MKKSFYDNSKSFPHNMDNLQILKYFHSLDEKSTSKFKRISKIKQRKRKKVLPANEVLEDLARNKRLFS